MGHGFRGIPGLIHWQTHNWLLLWTQPWSEATETWNLPSLEGMGVHLAQGWEVEV